MFIGREMFWAYKDYFKKKNLLHQFSMQITNGPW